MEVTSTPAQAASSTSSSNGVSMAPFSTIEPERIVEHLVDVCRIALGASQEELEQPGNLLHKSRHSDTVARCTRFAAESQNVLYIQKDIVPSSAVENGSDSAGKGTL